MDDRRKFDLEFLRDENHRLLQNNLVLASALTSIYATHGEDPKVAKLVNEAIELHSEIIE